MGGGARSKWGAIDDYGGGRELGSKRTGVPCEQGRDTAGTGTDTWAMATRSAGDRRPGQLDAPTYSHASGSLSW